MTSNKLEDKSIRLNKIDALCIIINRSVRVWLARLHNNMGKLLLCKNKFSIIKSIIYSWYNVDPSSETEGGHTNKNQAGSYVALTPPCGEKKNIRQDVHIVLTIH